MARGGIASVHLSGAAARIAAEIGQRGPITFERFMDVALYDSNLGYYARAAAGPGGDYVTSPELHPAFGLLLTLQFEEMWRHLGRPALFWLVEGGPGRGVFAADLLTWAQSSFPEFGAALHLALLERSPALRAHQKTRLKAWADRVLWLDFSLDSPQPLGPGCVFANELLDAFPIHRAVMRADGLREIYVGTRAGRLEEVQAEPSTPDLARQIRAGGGRLQNGGRGEVNLAGPAWVRSAAGLIERGYVLLLDYGEPANILYGPAHPRGTLRCYWQHTMNEEPFSRVGLQDITAHVDLSAVTRAASAEGLTLLGATRQARLLSRLGLPFLVGRIEEQVVELSRQRAHRAALTMLADSAGLGRLAAMAFGKSAPEAPLSGFWSSTPLEPPQADLWRLRGISLRGVIRSAEGGRRGEDAYGRAS